MIELIFVIVIIGILALIAIPKLSATRDDAKVVTEIQNLATCIQDIGTAYIATGKEANLTSLSSCSSLKCFAISGYGDSDGNITISNKNNTSNFCSDASQQAKDKKILGTISFGGSKITY